MRKRDVVGRRIVDVHQVWFCPRPRTKQRRIDVLAFVLDNGDRLIPITVETEDGEYAHDFAVWRGTKEPK